MMELARVLDVSINTIERWERGGAHPSPDNQEKINGYFGEEVEI
jgi:transcriptional regulator with XRE-family HTH domain